MTTLNMASRISMKSAQVIDCDQLSTLEAALQEVRAESEVLIFASLTEFLVNGGFNGTISSTIDPILTAVSAKIHGLCAARQGLQVIHYYSQIFI